MASFFSTTSTFLWFYWLQPNFIAELIKDMFPYILKNKTFQAFMFLLTEKLLYFGKSLIMSDQKPAREKIRNSMDDAPLTFLAYRLVSCEYRTVAYVGMGVLK